MPSLSSGLLRAGLALKLSQIKLAMRSYLRDRIHQATDAVVSYAIAAGLLAAAGVFLIAACLVGMAALFHWIEIRYGLFPAFGADRRVAACRCGDLRRHGRRTVETPGAAVSTADQPPPGCNQILNPVEPDQIEAARDTAEAILLTPSAPATRRNPRPPREAANGRWDTRKAQTGLIVTATLLGWAALRRRQVRRTVA